MATMDHFNITVQNGAMVSTRRGFQVSKQKHNGTAFVNSSVHDMNPKHSIKCKKPSLPIPGEITFVNSSEDGSGYVSNKRRARAAKEAAARITNSFVSDRRRLSSCTSTSSSSTSSTSSEDGHYSCSQAGSYRPDGDFRSLFHTLPPWASYSRPNNTTNSTQRMVFMMLAFGSINIHPLDEHNSVLNNPTHNTKDQVWSIKDPTSLHCAVTLGALFDAVKSGEYDSPGLNSLTSQLCFIINRRLNRMDQNAMVRDVTMHAIASLAIVAGYQGKTDH
ncbi:hypothetical protein BX600DRAFT_196651 [Xylariales sp. PMI_506]|nr:hypothetical protein BX600DRAFT_196651 [Xylariales sp. PMI_506]